MPAVLSPNLGLTLNLPVISIAERALAAGYGFRVQNGTLSNLNLGWTRFGSFTLDGPVTLIDVFFDRDRAQKLIFGTPTTLYRYDLGTGAVFNINPIYSVGTVSVTAGSPSQVTAESGSPTWQTAGIKPGDKIHFGTANQTDPTVTWYTIASVDSQTGLTLVETIGGGVFLTVPYTIRSVFTGDVDTQWSTATFLHEADGDEDWWIATNGVDDAVYWNGTSVSATSMGLGFKVNVVSVYKNMLICAGITDTGELLPTQVRNSDVGNPDDFASGLSEIFTAHDGSDAITRMEQLGDSLVLYSERHIILMDFVGDPLVFAFRTAGAGVGPIAGPYVAVHTDRHEFLGGDAGYIFDGATIREYGAQVLRYVLRQRDPERLNRGSVHFDEENGDLLWALPLNSDTGIGPESAWCQHYLEQTNVRDWTPFSVRAFPFTTTGYFQRQAQLTWDQVVGQWKDLDFRWNDIFFEAAFPFNLAGDAAGKIYTLGTAPTGNGAPLPSFIRFGRRPMGDGRMRGLIARIYPFVATRPGSTLLVRTRLADSALGSVTTVDEQPFDQALGEGGHFVSVFRVARYWEPEFATASDGWELSGYDYDIRPGGFR